MGRVIDILRRRRSTMLLEGALALVAVVVVLLAPGEAHGTAQVELSRAAGTLSLTNSRSGAAIFQAANMRPGRQVSGSVRVTNAGTLDAALRLAPNMARAADAPSAVLAARLQLVVSDVTDAGRPTTVYAGPLSAMGQLAVGALAAGRGRDFLFVASLPAGTPAADNLLQGATLAAGFTWTATAAAPAPPTPTATPQPPGPTPTPTPAPTVVPTPTPAPAACAPRRVKIRIRAHGRRILEVMVKVGHKHAKRVRPRARITVKVKGARPATVKVTATLSGGKRVVVKKRVPGCPVG
jgi:spore coat-associated protein N